MFQKSHFICLWLTKNLMWLLKFVEVLWWLTLMSDCDWCRDCDQTSEKASRPSSTALQNFAGRQKANFYFPQFRNRVTSFLYARSVMTFRVRVSNRCRCLRVVSVDYSVPYRVELKTSDVYVQDLIIFCVCDLHMLCHRTV